jgi:putative ABC transport system permease protein
VVRAGGNRPIGLEPDVRARRADDHHERDQTPRSRLPLVLALFFACFGAAALAQSMFMTARERRHDLAVLRGLGFTHRQVFVVLVAAAASVAVVALVVGVPFGVVVGRIGWRAVASRVFVAPITTVRLTAIALLALGLAVFAGLVALASTRVVLRLRPGSTLRAE